MALGLDSAPAVAGLVAEFLNLTGDPETINELYRRYAAVTPEQIQRVARETFKDTNRTVVELIHRELSAADASGAASEGGE
jgi:predicted Zn-dependent peptidase